MAIITTDVCLFDLDGTIISTTLACEQAWRKLCKEHNVDAEELLKVSHGTKTTEMMKAFFPQLDNTDNKAGRLLEIEISKSRDVSLIPGAEDLLNNLDRDSDSKAVFPERKWAIVTSGTPDLAFSWFSHILQHIGKPKVFITADDVSQGKPNPEGYARARDLICQTWGFDAKTAKSVVFEDAPVGVKAGKNMNATVIGIASSYDKSVLFAAGADYVVQDLTSVTVAKNLKNGAIELEIKNALTKD